MLPTLDHMIGTAIESRTRNSV
uniref:Uncharacterized protein n=1 Tax=Rhizophora mucronata TaxID=61149 RepID=A0A2P2P2V1_RHIMU